MKGWRITVDGFGDMACAAATRAKATYVAWRQAQEVGYTSVTFARIHTYRCERLDTWAAAQQRPALVNMEHAHV